MTTEKEKWEENYNKHGEEVFDKLLGNSKLTGGESFPFNSNKERALFIYAIATHKNVKMCDLEFINPHPTDYDPNYLFPRDVYLLCYRNDADKPFKAEANYTVFPFPKTFDEFYEKWTSYKYPMITMVFSIDDNDKQRVSVNNSIADTLGNLNLDDEGDKLINSLMPKGSIVVNRFSNEKEYNDIVNQILVDALNYVKQTK